MPQLGIGIGYLGARGYPKYGYWTATQHDDPIRSHQQVFDVALRAGHFLPLGDGGTRFDCGLGPALYWVKETADIRYEVLQDLIVVARGSRTESLERLRLGADAAVAVAFPVGESFRLGALARAWLVPWNSEQVKSLTLDFIERKTVVGLEIGLALAFGPF